MAEQCTIHQFMELDNPIVHSCSHDSLCTTLYYHPIFYGEAQRPSENVYLLFNKIKHNVGISYDIASNLELIGCFPVSYIALAYMAWSRKHTSCRQYVHNFRNCTIFILYQPLAHMNRWSINWNSTIWPYLVLRWALTKTSSFFCWGVIITGGPVWLQAV